MKQQTFKPSFSRFLLYVFLFQLPFTESKALKNLQHQYKRASNSSVSALLVFGDSTVDPGNNNFVPTIFRGNFPPYGQDFLGHIPTGRFSNGRLGTDFMASYLGVKDYVPPYLDPKLSTEELMTGVSFASAGTGFDPLTPKVGNVVPISSQVDYFKQYKRRLESALGKQKTETHIRNSVFFISAGTNDFVINYFTLPIRRKTYSPSGYQQFIIHQLRQFFQALWAEGGRRFVMPALAPMGCLPIVITLFSGNPLLQRDCLDQYSAVARDFNRLLQSELLSLQSRFSKKSPTFISYVDTYSLVDDMIHRPGKYGLDTVDVGCCGTGYLETSLFCNFKSAVCPNPTRYLFWDSIHPTEKTYYDVFRSAIPALNNVTRDLRRS